MLKWILLGLLVILVCGGVLFCWELIAVAVDHAIGFRTRGDVKSVQAQKVGTLTLGGIIGPDAQWSGRHRDELWRTFVECRTHQNGAEVVYHWEVDHGYSPRLGYGRDEGVFITPLTRDTGTLAPSLLASGMRLDRLPVAPSMTARAIYQHMGLAPQESAPPVISR